MDLIGSVRAILSLPACMSLEGSLTIEASDSFILRDLRAMCMDVLGNCWHEINLDVSHISSKVAYFRMGSVLRLWEVKKLRPPG